MFRGSKSRRQPLVLKRAARRGGRLVFFPAKKNVSSQFIVFVFVERHCTIQRRSAVKKAKLSAGGYSAVFIPSRIVCLCKSQLLCHPFRVFVEKTASVPPPSCCHPARASRAPYSKKLRFCFRAPVLSAGGGTRCDLT